MASSVLTLNINDLRKIVSPAQIEVLEQKKTDEDQLKVERECIHLKLNKTLHRLIQLDDEMNEDQISEKDYNFLDNLRRRLTLRHQLLAERLVRVGTQLARTKNELRSLESDIYENLTRRGLL
uniref:Uncharacterized protein n=1 Tax=Drosophila melanogaster TaxID=7227 RepID=M9PFD1_DROME|nr:uncharacterized protein Dmel_CG43638 [Drosophila melanogaster]AGB94434.1 uncharacterized protein Dmel_CG43638 [Drosophila melanogaster]|eukprot:NP_001261741.1 uncharacterized protein Dmel_CG43638 [Drosophila melanogaster]